MQFISYVCEQKFILDRAYLLQNSNRVFIHSGLYVLNYFTLDRDVKLSCDFANILFNAELARYLVKRLSYFHLFLKPAKIHGLSRFNICRLFLLTVFIPLFKYVFCKHCISFMFFKFI